MRWRSRILALGIFVLLSPTVVGQEPGWSGVIVARGSERVAIESTPMIYRSYRPFHVYGNTVRRRHYRGSAVPVASGYLRRGTITQSALVSSAEPRQRTHPPTRPLGFREIRPSTFPLPACFGRGGGNGNA